MKKINDIKLRISDSMGLPNEVICNIPNIKIVGNNEINIENHMGIIEYSAELLRINSGVGVIKVTGENLKINEINYEEVILTGEIKMIEFII